jgi:hypothetical protein
MVGIEIYNDDGAILIDGSGHNHRLLHKWSVQATTAMAMVGIVDATLAVSANAGSSPIFAVAAPPGAWVSLWAMNLTPTQANWKYMTTAVRGTSHECYAFQDGLSEPMAGTGLVVLRDAAGVVTFDADANYASIVDMVFVAPGQAFTRTYPAGRKYAVSNTVPMVWRSSGGPGGGWTNVSPYGAAISGNQVAFGKYQYRGTSPGSMSSGNSVGAWFMVLDVTGL